MATSVGQYAPVFLPGEPTFLTEAWQATVYRVAKSRTLLKQARARRHETSFACDSSASVRIEHEGGAAAWLAGTMAALSMQGHRLPPPQDPARVFLQASCGWQSEGLFGQSFSIAPPVQALRGLPCLESFSVVRCIRHIEGPPGWGPTL